MLRFIGRATNTGHSQRLWPVLAMLIAVVVLPTAGVLWFMNEAMQNEQLAVRQRLTDIYNARLEATSGQNPDLVARNDSGSVVPDSKKVPEVFASLVKAGHADSVLFYANAWYILSRLLYPAFGGTGNPTMVGSSTP